MKFNLSFAKITIQTYFEWIMISLGILFLVFDATLATIYWIIIGADFILYYFNYTPDRKILIPIESRTDNRFQSILTAVIAYGAFLIVSTVILKVFSPMSMVDGDYFSVIKLMATTVPIFAGSKILSEYAFGIMVPAIESSLFFGRLMERVSDIIGSKVGKNVNLRAFTFPTIFTIATCTALFVLYHLGSKGLANIPLLITGIFAIVSCAMVVYQGELKGAIMLHCISNSIVLLSQFKII